MVYRLRVYLLFISFSLLPVYWLIASLPANGLLASDLPAD
jgi:hypothetical protein